MVLGAKVHVNVVQITQVFVSSSLPYSIISLCVCVCVGVGVCVAIPPILDVRLIDAPAGVTQEGHTGFLHLPSAVLALIFLARRIQPSLSLVDREDEIIIVFHWT